MLLAARQRKFDVLLVWSIDRFSREGALAAFDILKKIEQTGVRFRNYTEQFPDSGGRFREDVINSLLRQQPVIGNLVLNHPLRHSQLLG